MNQFSPPARNSILLLFSILLLYTATFAEGCLQRYRDVVFNQVKINKNINFGGRKTNTDGTKTWMVMDIYEPKNDTAQLRPLVMLIHGGGFTNNPPLFRATPDIVELARSLALRGYVVVSPEYRLFGGENTFSKVAETAIAALIDINDATCFLVNAAENGNPYRIDPTRFFIGGSSAGAFLALNGSMISDTSEVPESYRPAMRRVAEFDQRNLQSILENKFCGMRPRVIVPISGALMDTTYVKPIDASILIIHGELDSAIPGGVGNIFGDPSMPQTFGSETMVEVFARAGIPVEADIYPNEGHVPVIWPFGEDLWFAIQQTLLTGSAVNPPVMDSTQRHMARMFYEALGSPQTICPTPTAIPENIVAGQLQIAPNPSGGVFKVELPADMSNKIIRVQLFNMAGQRIFDQHEQQGNQISIDISGQSAGIYIVSLLIDGTDGPKIYLDKVVKR
jgi:acetyl esterase/lipase